MKIIYYTDQVYLHGGIERVLANKLNYLVNIKDVEVHLITTEQKENTPCYNISEKVIMHDLGINYNREISYFHPLNFRKAPRHFVALKKKIKQINPNVVIVCNYAFDFYFIPYIFPKIPKIKEFHSSRHFEYKTRIENKSLLKKAYYKLNDYIESKYHFLVLLTDDEKKYYTSNNTIVIPNALTNLPNKLAKLDTKTVISAGRVAPVKGFEKLIQSWKLVSKKNPEWKLEIYGEGEVDYVDSLQKLIVQLQLEKKITLCGATNKMEDKMLDSSVYAMSSITECFPMVLLEAKTCGLPIVSFDCPNGPRNIIKNNEDGILVENENIEALAEGIINIIKNPIERKKMGAKAQINVQKFTQDNIMKSWLKLFEYKN